MNGFERVKEQNRVKILNAAEKLFNKYGIDKVTITDIASEAHVSKITIYNLFSNKYNLIHSYISANASAYIQRLQDLLKTDKSYFEKLESIVLLTAEVNEKSPSLQSLDLMSYPEWKQLVNSLFEQGRKLLLEFLKKGQKEGYINPKLSSEAINSYFKINFDGIDANPEIREKMRNNPKLLKDLYWMILYGFAKVG
jgi:AcrR family transcriptional regulator